MPKNFRSIPSDILLRLQRFALDDVVAACAKRIRPGDVDKYAHLGLRLADGALMTPPPAVPSAVAGKYSTYNVEGKDIVRKDLPKTTKTFSFYAPNWGDSSHGMHLVSHVREVYQREFIPPKEVELSVTLLEQQGDAWIVKFAIDQVISRSAPDFESDLLYNLNILQENVAAADVFESTATIEDYAATVRVDWELLPAGQIGPQDMAERLIAQAKAPTELQKATILSRLQIFEKLKPTHFISGTSGFARYFGAKYGDDFVVFENIRYGNAMYVMFEDWQTLSQKSRIDLLKGGREGFERIEHRENWEDKFKAMLEHYRKESRRRRR
jgi:hypothetical protein